VTREATLDTPDEPTESFATAVAETLREMAGVEAVVRSVVRAGGGGTDARGELEDVSAVLGLGADVPGWVILSLPRGTAAALAGRVLAGVAEPDEPMVRDCAAEVLNVIAGRAKSLLFGTPHHFTLATPVAVVGGGVDPEAGQSVVRFESDAGPFALHLLPPHAAAGTGG
jgi:chemotaxis protein CheX